MKQVFRNIHGVVKSREIHNQSVTVTIIQKSSNVGCNFKLAIFVIVNFS